MGQKLPIVCQEIGFKKIDTYDVHHHYSAKEAKLLVLSRIGEMKDKFITTGIADERKIGLWMDAMLAFPEDDQSFYLSSPQYHVLAWK